MTHTLAQCCAVLADGFKRAKQLQKTKKRLKSRFWTEIYAGAKLFYLSGLVNGLYQVQAAASQESCFFFALYKQLARHARNCRRRRSATANVATTAE